MNRRGFLLSVGLAAVATVGNAAAGQHEGHQVGAPPSAAQVTECRQAQPVITELLNGALKRLEDARLTNSAAAMRDAADDVQAALVDMRTQFAPCSVMQAAAAEAPAGQAAPGAVETPAAAGTRAIQPSPATPVAATPHGEHAAPAAPAATSRTPAATPARPSGSPQRPAAPSAAADSHAGHTTPAPSTSASRAPAATPARLSASPQPFAAPAAADSHAGQATPTASAPPVTPSASGGSAAAPPTTIADLKCPSTVDARTAPRMLYQGRMYYFCTEASRAEFAKDPGKFVTAPPQAAPAHAH